MSNKSAVILIIAVALSVLIGTLALMTGRDDARRFSTPVTVPTTVPMRQDAYVWQREWTPSVHDAVASQHQQFHELVVLAGEVSQLGKDPDAPGKVTVVHPDYAAIAKSVRTIGIAIRVGPAAGSFIYEADSPQTILLCDTVKNALAAPVAAGLSVAEVQIDFDCAESKLTGYRRWVSAIKANIAPTPVVITALPSWLKHAEFAALAREAGSFVIQVHSLHQPSDPDAPMSICDPVEALAAVNQASQIGVGFRVALPTYSYLAGFSSQRKFLGLSADGPAANWPTGTILRMMRSDPASIAPLVAKWIARPPQNMTGIIWYRLPVPGEELNWSAVTLKTVMTGSTPQPNCILETARNTKGVIDVYLHNIGNGDATSPQRFKLDGQNGAISEAIHGFTCLEDAKGSVIFLDSSTTGRRIAPGEKIQIGWLRPMWDREVQTDVLQPTAQPTPPPGSSRQEQR